MTRAYPLASPDVPDASAPSFIYSSPCPGGRGLLMGFNGVIEGNHPLWAVTHAERLHPDL